MNDGPHDDAGTGAACGLPAMSVVLATPDGYATVRKTMSELARQTVRERLEIILVAPSRAGLDADTSDLAGFFGYRVVEIGPIRSIGQANAAGVRAASAAIVALAEDHCFPERDWAEKLIAAHRGPWAAVGPAVRNANPRTAVSWADLFIGYGPWLSPKPAGEVELLPGHNTSYKRAALLAYGEDLDAMLGAETLLHWDLRRTGKRLYLEPAAVVAHTNFSRWSSWLPVQYHNGRLFAGSRVRAMSPLQRAVYVVGAPLIPVVRLLRVARPALRSRQLLAALLGCAHALAIGLTLDGLGQLVGYAAGVGDAVERVASFEFHRVRHVTEQDRGVFAV